MKKLFCFLASLSVVVSCYAEPLRIVAYGDSLTYGWMPTPNPPSTRFAFEDRWPGALCPPALSPVIDKGPVFGEMFKGGLEKSKQLSALYEAVAKMGGADF